MANRRARGHTQASWSVRAAVVVFVWVVFVFLLAVELVVLLAAVVFGFGAVAVVDPCLG